MTTEKHYSYPPQKPEEFEALCQIVREAKPEAIMEIGSRHGRSLLRLSEAAMPSLRRVYSLDLPDASWGASGSQEPLSRLIEELRERGVDALLTLGDSHDPEIITKFSGVRVDFLFIDGDHTYEGVKADFQNFSRLVRPGGIVAFHDIRGNGGMVSRGSRMGVQEYWREVSQGRDSLELLADGTNMGIGVLRV